MMAERNANPTTKKELTRLYNSVNNYNNNYSNTYIILSTWCNTVVIAQYCKWPKFPFQLNHLLTQT